MCVSSICYRQIRVCPVYVMQGEVKNIKSGILDNFYLLQIITRQQANLPELLRYATLFLRTP